MTCQVMEGGFDEARSLWHDLLDKRSWTSIFLTPEWQGVWWDEFGGDAGDLRLLRVGPADAPLGLAPLRFNDGEITFVGNTDLFDYHDFIDVAPGFHQSLAQHLAGQPWRTFDLRSIPAFSPSMTAVPEAFRAIGCHVTIEDEDVAPGVQLPSTWDEFLARLRKKDRHELRRKLRRLEGAGEVRVVESTRDTLEDDFGLFLELMAESSDEKRAFMEPRRKQFFRRIVDWASDEDYLRLQFLELNGEKLATTMSFDYDGRRLLYNSGYRIEQSPLAVGLMLKALCIKDAIERGLTYFDFLRGPEPYKYDLGGQNVGLHRIVVRR